MVIEKRITIELTPDEVRDIIKTYLFKSKNINVDNVDFNLEITYSEDDYPDDRGSFELTKIVCDGILEND